ncbi:MAG TPA: hypothetical protein VKV77_05185 [Methylovirgula sp.]|nr:hypothetical protein [Methylovirgula sp.]
MTQKVGTVREESTWVAALEPLERLVGELSHTLALISGREQDSQQKVKIVEFGKSDRRQSTLQPTRPGNSPQPHDISNATRLHTSPNAISGFGRKMENSRSADERNSVSPDGFRDQSAVLAKIEEAIESLATKIEEITRDRDQSQYEALSQRIDDLRQELIQRIADAWFAPDTKPLEDLLNGISEKLDYAQATSGERRAIEAVEEQLAELTDRFDRASANIPSLVSIQASILELFSEMEKTRDVALEAAENAVRNVLEEAAGRPHSADLESQIQTLRNLQEEDDQRTLSVLTTIHRVLETLTNRLARVEDELSARHAELPDLGIRSDEGGPAFDGLMRERAGGQDHKSGSSDRLAAARLAGRAAEGAKSRDSAIDRPGSHGLLHRLSKLVGP